jgi:hypothetical protein
VLCDFDAACHPRRRNGEFLAFLKQVATAHPRVKLRVVCGNYGTHGHPNVKAWPARNPRITLRFTPTGASWMNLVEIFFGIIARQAIWTKTADQMLTKASWQPRLMPSGQEPDDRARCPPWPTS